MEHGLEGVLPTAAHTEPPGLNLVIPNIMLGRQGRQQGPPQAPKAQQLPAGLSAASHFVFFGRLEARKGLWVFCNALLRLADADRPVLPTRVTFLGPETMIGKKRSVGVLGRGENDLPNRPPMPSRPLPPPRLATAAIREHLADHGHSVAALASAGCSIAFETKRDTAQAMAVLREPSTVAFVPAVVRASLPTSSSQMRFIFLTCSISTSGRQLSVCCHGAPRPRPSLCDNKRRRNPRDDCPRSGGSTSFVSIQTNLRSPTPEHRAAVTVPVDDPQALADRMLTALRSGVKFVCGRLPFQPHPSHMNSNWNLNNPSDLFY